MEEIPINIYFSISFSQSLPRSLTQNYVEQENCYNIDRMIIRNHSSVESKRKIVVIQEEVLSIPIEGANTKEWSTHWYKSSSSSSQDASKYSHPSWPLFLEKTWQKNMERKYKNTLSTYHTWSVFNVNTSSFLLFQFTVTPPKYFKDETVRLNAELFLQLDHKIVWWHRTLTTT